MSATILSFFRVKTSPNDWTQEELAEFYRVEAALMQGNMPVVTDRGVSDEGDPWFVFCREDNGEIIAHFARIGSQYVIVSSAFSGIARGRDFRGLIGDLMSEHPLMLPRKPERSQKVFIHPAALLVALVATSFLISSEKDVNDHRSSEHKDAPRLFSLTDFSMLSAVAIAVTWVENQLNSGLQHLRPDDDSALLQDHASGHDAVVNSIPSNVVQLDDAFDNALHKFFTEALASDLNLASTIPNENLTLIQTPVVPLFGQSIFKNLADAGFSPLPTTSDAIKYHDTLALNTADSIQLVGAPVSELNINAASPVTPADAKSPHPVPTSTGQSNDVGAGSVNPVSASAGSGSIFPISIDAYKTFNSEIGANGSNSLIVLTNQNLSVDGAIHQAMSHAGYQESAIQNVAAPNLEQAATNSDRPVNSIETEDSGTKTVAANAIAASANDIIMHSSASSTGAAVSPVASYDSQVAAILVAFKENTPHYQIDAVGNNLVVVDTNTMDIWNSGFGMQTWTMGDGSTLTIVGIIPHLVHAGTGAGATATS